MTLQTIGLPIKVLFTCFLLTIGLGYLFAVIYLFLIDLEPHSKKGIGMVQSVIIKYYGQRGTTRLEAALEGSMGENVTAAQREAMVEWIRKGAREDGYDAVEPIFSNQCVGCHGRESDMGLSPLETLEDIRAYTGLDFGQSVKTLARVSHIHLFGMSFIFLLTGGIFALSGVRPVWRALWAAMPFLSIWMDIGSWWFTRFQPLFAYTVIVGGLLMGTALAVQILWPVYEMWFSRTRTGRA